MLPVLFLVAVLTFLCSLLLFQVCPDEGDCHEGSHFSVLGGSAEMPWAFDRLYKMEITSILKEMHLEADSHFTIKTKIIAQNNTELFHILPEPTIIRIPPAGKLIYPSITTNSISNFNLFSFFLINHLTRSYFNEYYTLICFPVLQVTILK